MTESALREFYDYDDFLETSDWCEEKLSLDFLREFSNRINWKVIFDHMYFWHLDEAAYGDVKPKSYEEFCREYNEQFCKEYFPEWT